MLQTTSFLRVLMRFVPLFVVEVFARFGGYLINLYRPEYRFLAQRRIRGMYWGARLGTKELKIGRNVQIETDRIRLGHNITLFDGGQYVTGPTGWISIGENSHVARLSVISGAGGVEIGEGCAISGQVLIYSVTTDTHTAELHKAGSIKVPVKIGNNVFIGAGVRIIPGVSIGDNAVVAAGAVVIKDIPSNHLAFGVPAKFAPLKSRV